jgi:hypothetical protein
MGKKSFFIVRSVSFYKLPMAKVLALQIPLLFQECVIFSERLRTRDNLLHHPAKSVLQGSGN